MKLPRVIVHSDVNSRGFKKFSSFAHVGEFVIESTSTARIARRGDACWSVRKKDKKTPEQGAMLLPFRVAVTWARENGSAPQA